MAAADPMPPAGIAASAVHVSASRIGWLKGRGDVKLWFGKLRQALADGSLFFGIATIAVFMLSRPFEGIEGDGQIYMARALADQDAMGIGRDIMFVHDGQSQFSIFPFIAARLVAALNPANTSLLLALLSIACWFAAAQFFIGRFAEGRMKWAILMILAALPGFYGAFHLLRFAEQFATPRPFAEACVLAALGFLIDRRRVLALALLALAFALHPIMALPGLLIFWIDLCRADRRWIAAGLGLALIGAIAVATGLPLFDRLATTIDPDWLALLRLRNAYLFPTLWPFEAFAFLALQIATVLVAADLLAPRVRWIFLAAAALGAAGLAISVLFGDLWPLLLVVQAQLWRMSWLLGIAAGIALALCLLRLPERGPRVELASAFLALGWLLWDEPLPALLAACAALILHHLSGLTFALRRPVLNMIWGAVLSIGILVRLGPTMAFIKYAASSPADFHPAVSLFWNIYLVSIPIVVFAVLYVWRPALISPKVTGAFAAVTVLCVIGLWDDRDPRHKVLDSGRHQAALAALLPADHSEIYWMGGVVEPWFYAGRPGWALYIQGAGSVFSRPLAMVWRDRVEALISSGLADQSLRGAQTLAPREDAVPLRRAAIDGLCARKDAPGAIVAPLEEGMAEPSDLKFKIWQPPAPQFRLTQKGETVTWHRVEKFLVLSCTDHVPEL
ncbi:hypothetical protein [Methyloferula stellata]|uniref:hypothetical protein n=1 Tax=Methyloferula stellata TaxID=876270 RepID=UPI0003667562|nr:hypothetical protein [Methyloferula stellata]